MLEPLEEPEDDTASWSSNVPGGVSPIRPSTHCAVEGDFLACGSESNEVYVYYKALSKPIAHQTMTASVHGENESQSTLVKVLEPALRPLPGDVVGWSTFKGLVRSMPGIIPSACIM